MKKEWNTSCSLMVAGIWARPRRNPRNAHRYAIRRLVHPLFAGQTTTNADANIDVYKEVDKSIYQGDRVNG
jgi:hypothetical protein